MNNQENSLQPNQVNSTPNSLIEPPDQAIIHSATENDSAIKINAALSDQKPVNLTSITSENTSELVTDKDIILNNHDLEANNSFDKHLSPNDTSESNDDQKNSRTGTLITILLVAIIIGGIWQTNKDNRGQPGETDNEVNIVVDSSKETGNVTIVNGETQINPVAGQADTVKIIAFYNQKSSNECDNVVSHERTIEKKYDSAVINTVRGLLTPLSEAELKAGLVSSIPPDTYLRSITITDGVAKAVFSSALNKVAGSCRVLGIRAQIEKTLKQFPFIKSVAICIDDNCNQSEILQP